MSDHVYKTVEITGTSPDGVQAAIDRALSKAGESLRNLDWFEVTEIRGARSQLAHESSSRKPILSVVW